MVLLGTWAVRRTSQADRTLLANRVPMMRAKRKMKEQGLGYELPVYSHKNQRGGKFAKMQHGRIAERKGREIAETRNWLRRCEYSPTSSAHSLTLLVRRLVAR